MLEFKTKDLELQIRIALLESNNSQKDQPSTSNLLPIQISSQDTKDNQINIIDRINFQNGIFSFCLKCESHFLKYYSITR